MPTKKRVYLAGPMRGYEKYNFPAFAVAAFKLRERGYVVFSPAENDYLRYGDNFIEDNLPFDLRMTMADDLRWICHYADAIALLPGWEESTGVAVELALAKCLKLEVIELAA